MRATMRRPYGWVLLLSALLDVLSVDTVHAVGIITTVAGGGPADGTPALSQPLYPSAVSVDQAGDVIVTEGLNPQHRSTTVPAPATSATAGPPSRRASATRQEPWSMAGAISSSSTTGINASAVWTR